MSVQYFALSHADVGREQFFGGVFWFWFAFTVVAPLIVEDFLVADPEIPAACGAFFRCCEGTVFTCLGLYYIFRHHMSIPCSLSLCL